MSSLVQVVFSSPVSFKWAGFQRKLVIWKKLRSVVVDDGTYDRYSDKCIWKKIDQWHERRSKTLLKIFDPVWNPVKLLFELASPFNFTLDTITTGCWWWWWWWCDDVLSWSGFGQRLWWWGRPRARTHCPSISFGHNCREASWGIFYRTQVRS